MKPFQPGSSSILRINGHLFVAFACGFTAWTIWPQSPQWWGLGLVSFVLALTAVAETIKALRLMVARYAKERALTDYAAQGRRPRSARLVDTDDLRRAGMVDD